MDTRGVYYPLILTLLLFDGIIVALRIWARQKYTSIGYDDIALVISYFSFAIFGAMELASISYGIGAYDMEPGFDMTKAAMFFTIGQVMYIFAACVSKLGVGTVLYRLCDQSGQRAIRLALLLSMVVQSLWSLVSALIIGMQCIPLSVAWGVGKGTCLSTTVLGNTGIALSTMDVVVSWLYALLPIKMLYNVQLPARKKIPILVLLGLGAISIATIVRLRDVVQVARMSSSAGLASQEVVQKSLEGTIYSIVEIGVSIFTAALTALRHICYVLRGTEIKRDGSANSVTLHSKRTIDRRSTVPTYPLEDLDEQLSESQENIVPPKPSIQKRTSIQIDYDSSVPHNLPGVAW